MKTPYIGFGNDTLKKLQTVSEGHLIDCSCGEKHPLECGISEGKKDALLMFYRCGEKLYLGAVNGRLTVGVRADASGEI